jgi:hypothetical protein
MLQSAEQEQHEGVVYSRKVREGQRMGNDLEVNAREKKIPCRRAADPVICSPSRIAATRPFPHLKASPTTLDRIDFGFGSIPSGFGN